MNLSRLMIRLQLSSLRPDPEAGFKLAPQSHYVCVSVHVVVLEVAHKIHCSTISQPGQLMTCVVLAVLFMFSFVQCSLSTRHSPTRGVHVLLLRLVWT